MYRNFLTGGLLFVAVALSHPATAQEWRAEMDGLTETYQQLNWNGVLLVGDTNGIRYRRALGWARLESGQPMKEDTWFKTESVGKMFTAVRILQLAAEGKIGLEQTLSERLPDWKIPKAEQITVTHLLNHTSGLTSPWEHPAYEFGKIYSAAEIKRMIEESPLALEEPGQKSYYSNSAYILLAEMIARIDGKPFEASVQEHIFGPAGMQHTRSLNDSVLPPQAAQPYYPVTPTRFVQDETKYGDGRASGAGGWMSTAGDLFRFAQAWRRGQLLSPYWMDIQITNNHLVDSSSPYRRLGLHVLREKPPGHFVIGHNGGGKGFSVDVYLDYYKGDIVVWCSNQYGAAYELTGRVFSVLNGRSYSPPTPSPRLLLADWLLRQPTDSLPVLSDRVLRQCGISKADEFFFLTLYDHLYLLGAFRAAWATIAEARSRFPESVHACIKSGECAVSLGQSDWARLFYEEALKKTLRTGNLPFQEMIRERLRALRP